MTSQEEIYNLIRVLERPVLIYVLLKLCVHSFTNDQLVKEINNIDIDDIHLKIKNTGGKMLQPIEQETKFKDLQQEIEKAESLLQAFKNNRTNLRQYVNEDKKLKLAIRKTKKELRKKYSAREIINNFLGNPLEEKQEDLFEDQNKEVNNG